MRAKSDSVQSLLAGIAKAQDDQDFNFLKDLKMLRERYVKISKRDYLSLLDALIEKYEVDEVATVHAALLRKCKEGNIEAIRLYRETQAAGEGGSGEVIIVDSI